MAWEFFTDDEILRATAGMPARILDLPPEGKGYKLQYYAISNRINGLTSLLKY